MAERRYNKADQQKMAQDKFHELKSRGCIDAQRVSDVIPMSPDGLNGSLSEMLKDKSATKDQSQACLEHGKETLKDRQAESKERMEKKKEAQKKGSYE